MDTAIEKLVKAMGDAFDALEGKTPKGEEEPGWGAKAIDYGATGIGALAGALGAGAISGGLGTLAGGVAGGAGGHMVGQWLNEKLGLVKPTGGNDQTKAAHLKVRPSGDTTSGGDVDDRTIKAAQVIQAAFGDNFGVFTSLKDAYHKGFPGSDHNQGLAFDFTTNPPPKDAAEAAAVKKQIDSLLTSSGLKPRYIGDEYFADKVPGTTGGHFHVSLPKMAKGGITDGLSIAGEAGPEAVIPLPDGRSVPVKMDLADLLDKFDQMIKIMSDHKDVSEKHMKAAV
jgi:hypothetical protein